MLVGLLIPTALVEFALRPDLIWPAVALGLALGLVITLLWRRTHPLAMVAVVFGTLDRPVHRHHLHDVRSVGLYTSVYVLLLPYALLRWGIGAEVMVGLPIILVAYALGIAADYTGVADAVAATVFAVFPAVLGALVRYQSSYQATRSDQIKLIEREQLARELHDTVAHHVSAIAIRAQAGRVVGSDRPSGRRRLPADHRGGGLANAHRDAADGGRPPRRRGAGARTAARGRRHRATRHAAGDSPPVTVQLTGDLDDLRPSVGSAVYRLAQESITNARRHARHATRVDVRVDGADTCVRLSVADDGDAHPAGRSWSGYGMLGMTERATLLGGTLEAGLARIGAGR